MSSHEPESRRPHEVADGHRVTWFDGDRPVSGGTVFARAEEGDGERLDTDA